MKELTHDGTCNRVHPDISHEKWEEKEQKKEETNEEQELDELVDYDGSLLSSKIPLGINKTNKISRSTSDDVVKTAHQKGNGLGYYYKRYWGESYLGGGLSDVEDIDTMSADETIDHFEDEYGLSPLRAHEKASEYGKIVNGSEEDLHDEKQRIVELGNNKMKDMLEILLSKDAKNTERGLVDTDKPIELHDENNDNPILTKMGTKFKQACDAHGINPQDILKNI